MLKSGELFYVDLHHLATCITICNNNQSYYLLGLIDGYSRLAWFEVLDSKRALDVMFSFFEVLCMKIYLILRMNYWAFWFIIMTIVLILHCRD
ncbi:MAG: hypothetical protein FWG85_04175 [Bacteroidetes bacterium]|nr:hypothetical protein [Bacteroidota bacterium]